MRRCGIEPNVIPTRGGTDGSALSFRGLPCPNIGVGGFNYHGVNEGVCVQSMEKTVSVIVEIAKAPL
jgi:tripeptide aminopeptidase